MTVETFRLPDVGEGVAEGELVRWLVAPGDRVDEDQPIVEVETDKALVEIPSRYEGVVTELHAEEGEMVPVGERLISIEVDGDEGEPAAVAEGEADADSAADVANESEAESEAESEPSAEPEPEDEPAAEPEDEDEPAAETPVESEPAPAADSDTEPEGDAPAPSDGRVFAAPSTRRLARELGVDLGAVSGSGPGGRVTDADVRAAASDEGDEGDGAEAEEATEATEAAGEATEPRTVDFDEAEPAVRRQDEAEPAAEGAGEPEAESESGVRRESSVAVDEATEAATAVSGSVERREKTLAAPATRRLARDLGVDIDAVPTDESRDGVPFVTPAMVHEFVERQRDEAKAAAEGVEAEAATEGEAEEAETAASDAGTPPESEAEATAPSEPAGPRPGDTIPYRGIRRAIGEQMERSKYTAPHVTHHDDVDVTALVALRDDLVDYAEAEGVRLTYTHFVMKAVAAALQEFPSVNASLDEEEEVIRLHDEYNVGVATATDAGLLVPVVEDVDEKDLLDVAAETNERVGRARDRSISRSEMQGGTFTVTNVGVIGGEYATPIVNYPEVAILALGELKERPRVVDGEVVARHTLPLSLSVDHRVVDGAVAARFTNRVAESLAHPARLLLD